jgi:hypothetical protein
MEKFRWSFVLLLVLSCTTEQSVEHSESNIRVIRDASGNIKSRVTVKNDTIIHGPAVIFYEGGELVSTEVNYRNNRKHGIEKKYYKTGELYRERPFVDGKLTGVEKRYYKNGQLRTEVEYQDSNPATGLKEYTLSGILVTEYPEMIMTANETEDGMIRLNFKFDDGSRSVKYYEGTLLEGKYFDRNATPLGEQGGIGEKLLYKGEQSEINITARLTTRNNAPYIVSKRFMIK